MTLGGLRAHSAHHGLLHTGSPGLACSLNTGAHPWYNAAVYCQVFPHKLLGGVSSHLPYRDMQFFKKWGVDFLKKNIYFIFK